MTLLAPHESGSPLWQKIEAHIKFRLIKHRARIENPRITEAERMQLAWQIATIKEFLAMGNPAREVADAE